VTEQDWLGALIEAIGEPSIAGSADPHRPAPTANDEVDWPARLARVERLLAADLDRLGPAVLVESVSEIHIRLGVLARRLDAMVAVAELVGDGGNAASTDVSTRHGRWAVVPTEQLQGLARRLAELHARATLTERRFEEMADLQQQLLLRLGEVLIRLDRGADERVD